MLAGHASSDLAQHLDAFIFSPGTMGLKLVLLRFRIQYLAWLAYLRIGWVSCSKETVHCSSADFRSVIRRHPLSLIVRLFMCRPERFDWHIWQIIVSMIPPLCTCPSKPNPTLLAANGMNNAN